MQGSPELDVDRGSCERVGVRGDIPVCCPCDRLCYKVCCLVSILCSIVARLTFTNWHRNI